MPRGTGSPATTREPGFSPRWPEVYYAVTLVFALIDWAMGTNVRAVALDNAPVIRAGYYAACVLCAVVIWYRPRLATVITVVESALNVGILIVSVFLAYYSVVDAIERPGPFTNPLTGRLLLNFVIAGGAGTAAFYQTLHSLRQEDHH